jgi:membrane-bound ClpP family serine protease
MYPVVWTFLFFGLAFIIAILEIFVPSGGILAVLAIALLVTSIFFSFQVNVFFGCIYTLFVCLLVPVFLWVALRMWPQTWIGRQILLTPEDDPALVPNEELMSLKQLVGKYGMAKSKMLLGGLIEIEGKRYNAVSDAEPIESGEIVNVIRIEGTSIIVRKSSLADSHLAGTPLQSPPPLEDPFAT